MAKAINVDSVRQQIIDVLYDNGGPMKAAAVQKELVERGLDKKKIHVHSHLQAFKNAKTPKVVHDLEQGTYTLTDEARKAYLEQRGLELIEA